MPLPVALILSAIGGYVDTVGFLALGGLFTAHVTGNFVMLGAALSLGSTGVISKLLALPVFCLAVVLTHLAGRWLLRRGQPAFRRLLWAQCALLSVGAVLVLRLHPLAEPDHWAAVLTGMVFVTAMAIQNAAHRTHLASAPPSTLMTGTTTQLMLDLADIIGHAPKSDAARERMKHMAASVAAFAFGCFAGALLLMAAGPWAFVVPALAVLLAACGEETLTVEERKPSA